MIVISISFECDFTFVALRLTYSFLVRTSGWMDATFLYFTLLLSHILCPHHWCDGINAARRLMPDDVMRV